MKNINIEFFDCIFAAGLLFIILSFLIKLLQKNNYEGLQELNKTVNNNIISKKENNTDNNINILQYPKRKNMQPPPSLKYDVSKLDTSVTSNTSSTNDASLTVINSSLEQPKAPQNSHLHLIN